MDASTVARRSDARIRPPHTHKIRNGGGVGVVIEGRAEDVSARKTQVGLQGGDGKHRAGPKTHPVKKFPLEPVEKSLGVEGLKVFSKGPVGAVFAPKFRLNVETRRRRQDGNEQ